MFDLTGKVALVTGASGSLGKAIAIALAWAGADVACQYRKNREAAESLKAEIEKIGRRCVILEGDLTNSADAERIADETVERLGNLHILVNNAGVNRESLLIRQKQELVEEVLSNNLASMLYMSKAAARKMAKNHWGRMIHMSSVVAHLGSTAQVAYAASKGGVEGMSRAIARELGHRNITSNVLAPGFLTGGMSEDMTEERQNELMKYIAIPRKGTPEEVGAAVVYLASEEAGYITGTVLHLNGGMHME
ncbi:MAG: 3-oxoacyl-ACP reductase family protein [bacterium]